MHYMTSPEEQLPSWAAPTEAWRQRFQLAHELSAEHRRSRRSQPIKQTAEAKAAPRLCMCPA